MRSRDRGKEKSVPETGIRREESRCAGFGFCFRRNQAESQRAATIPSGPEQASRHRASAAWLLDMLACSCPPSHRHRERKQSMVSAMRELAAGDARRSGQSKCAKVERRFSLKSPATREARRPKFATAYRAVGETRSVAENAAPVSGRCRSYQMGNGPNFRVSAR